MEWSYRVDATRSPREIRMQCHKGPKGAIANLSGIYEFRDDGPLLLALTGPDGRPPEFQTTPTTSHRVLILERVGRQ